MLLYPAGRIYVQPFENIVGKQAAYEVASNLPDSAKILVVRTRGLWGSVWSKAYTGESPSLGKVALFGLGAILANGIFFVPKRKVEIEIVDMTEELRKTAKNGLDAFNARLESHYNENGNESCAFLSHYRIVDDTKDKTEPVAIRGSVAELNQTSNHDTSIVPEEVWTTIKTKIAEIRETDATAISNTANLILDLHFDSLDLAEIKSYVQSKYSASSNPPLLDLKTVADLAIMAIGKSGKEAELPPCDWGTEKCIGCCCGGGREDSTDTDAIPEDSIPENAIPTIDQTKTVPELFKAVFSQPDGSAPFVYDANFGLQTRKEFTLKAYVLAQYLRGIKEERVGIMLPATPAASMLIIASMLAGKVPVMLNWTIGDRAFRHCMDFAGIKTILTSKAFYEKIRTPWLEAYDNSFVFLETALPKLPLTTKLMGALRSRLFSLPKNAPKDAVMLFTSGSESLPKAVALTHENLVANIAGSLSIFQLTLDDILLGFLPPFHSFGFTINTIMPLITGLRVAYTPDPNDSKTIAKLLSHVGATTVTSTPTFFRSVLNAAKTEEVATLCYAVLGAEKCPQDLADALAAKCPKAKILEGYGITECSPVISINPIAQPKLGSVGKVIAPLECTIRKIDDKSVATTGEQGMIFVRGASVFGGYLDASIASPFEELTDASTTGAPGTDAAHWYSTGDLGYLDEDGYLFITGRMKRFVKIAGEMVSLPFIETILLEKYGLPDSVAIAVEAVEKNGEVRITIFSTVTADLEEANAYLRSK